MAWGWLPVKTDKCNLSAATPAFLACLQGYMERKQNCRGGLCWLEALSDKVKANIDKGKRGKRISLHSYCGLALCLLSVSMIEDMFTTKDVFFNKRDEHRFFLSMSWHRERASILPNNELLQRILRHNHYYYYIIYMLIIKDIM